MTGQEKFDTCRFRSANPRKIGCCASPSKHECKKKGGFTDPETCEKCDLYATKIIKK